MGKAQIFKINSPDRNLIFTLKKHVFNLFEEPANNLWTFDLEGRPVGMFINGVNYRRTLDNRFFKKSRKIINGEVYRQVMQVPSTQTKLLLEKGTSLLNNNYNRLPGSYRNISQKILETDFEKLKESARIFSQIYLPVSILPPDQYLSLVIQLTEGCNYNKCTFCNFYRDRPFRIKAPDELDIHLKKIKSFFGEGLALRKSIFLADANALGAPQKRLLSAMEKISVAFPEIQNMFSFVDVFIGIKKSGKDFTQLANSGIKRVYLGVESGNSDLLELLNKPQKTDDIIELSENLKYAGIQLGLIFLTGAGGGLYAEKHLQDSIKLIERLPLSKGDIIYISEFVETNPEYRAALESRKIPLPDRQQIRQLSNKFKSALRSIAPKGVTVSVYDITQFFY